MELHREVDERASRVAALHGSRLRCGRGCSGCCIDGLTVLEVEAELIRRRHLELCETGEPNPPGACAFLDAEGACRIYESRPYVCRTQGLPLRWFEENEQSEIEEHRDICPLNAEGPALESIADEACWLVGPYEQRLVEIQQRVSDGELPRVALRELFSRSPRRSSCSR